jgi:antitoxin component YwqK of YwqJK toxin-antitoxin module
MNPYKFIDFIANKVPEYSYKNLEKISGIPLPVSGEGYFDENGLKQGLFKSTILTVNYVDDEMHGKYEEFYNNGKLFMKGSYKHGKKVGEWVCYYTDGILDWKGYYKNGRPHGYFEEYYTDGTMFENGNYKNGVKVGIWNYYNIEGKLKDQVNHSI